LFYNLLTDNAKKELPINPNLPIVFLGEEKLIRSILYGDLFETNEVTNNEYPRNEEAFTYLNQSWKSLDFYGNNPTQEDIQTLEKRLAEVAKPFSPKVRYDNFPIFRYNTTNSNVTDISSEENNMYYSLLYTGLTEYPKIYDQYKANEEEIKLKELAVKTRISISLAQSLSFYIDRRTEKSFKLRNLSLEEYKKLKALVKKIKGDYELVLKFVEYLLENDIQLDAEINEDLLKDIPFFEEFSEYSIQSLILIAKTVVELLNNDEKDPSLPTVNIREKLQAIKNQQDFIDSGVSLDGTKLILDPTITYYDLFNFIDQIPIQVELTTLPFFRISNFFWLGYPCLLFANRPDLISSNNLDPLDSYLTGAYIINSVKHKISNDRCESIFTLTKYSEGVKAKTANVNG